MADDVTYDHLSEDGGFKPVHLLATGYDFQALEKEARRIETDLKTSKGQSDALSRMPTSLALDQERIEAMDKPALPEGTKLAEIEDAQGRMVEAPVALADKEERVAELPEVPDEDEIPAETRAVLENRPLADFVPPDEDDAATDTKATDEAADETTQQAEAAPEPKTTSSRASKSSTTA